MKKLILSTAFVLAGIASASAQLSFNQGDLILGFRVTSGTGTGATTNLEVDLGAATNFIGLPAGTVLSLNSTGVTSPGLNVADLVATYGSNWATRTDLAFGFFAADTNLGTGANTVSVSDVSTTNKPHNSTDLSGVAGQMEGGYSNPNQTPNSSTSGTTTADANNAGNYTSTVRPTGATQDYNAFSFATENKVASGSPAKSYLYDLNESGTGVANQDGWFLLSSNGTLTFNTAAAVPEPSAYALGICAVLLFVVLRRRQMVA